MLIRNAELHFNVIADVRVDASVVSAIGQKLSPSAGEAVLEANGAALLPGLHDHHIHLASLAASLDSVQCGPPQVTSAEELGQRLQEKTAAGSRKDQWIRGIAYHESVAGDIDRDWIDRFVPDTPVRIQHRSGRLWILNACALERLCPNGSAARQEALEKIDGRPTGRIFDGDRWLREKLGGSFPSLRRVSALLAMHGVTGVTDATPHNALLQYRQFVAEKESGALVQDILVMGSASLEQAADGESIWRGATKIHLREIALPPFDALCAEIRQSHETDRPVAIHCVTVAELVFAASVLATCGAHHGDRIEHAALAPPETLPLLADLGVTVVTQPGFIGERGDAYIAHVPTVDQPWLYRARGLMDAGIRLAGSSDAPFGDPSPWLAMNAAVRRQAPSGTVLGAAEALSPEDALALFMGNLRTPGGPPRRIDVGVLADLCLLDRPWAKARQDLAAVRVAATIKNGNFIWQAPPLPAG